MKYSNCIIFAFARWFRRGGYFIVTKSKHGPWLHVLWSKDLVEFEEYNPVWNKRLWTRSYPPLLFRGRVRTYRPRSRS